MNLPTTWTMASFKEVCAYIQRGKSPKYTNHSQYPVINQKCIRWNGIEEEHLKFISPEQWPSWGEERHLKEGDILWNSTGTGTIGRACQFKPLSSFNHVVADSHVTILRPNDGILSSYIYYYIRSSFIQKKIDEMQAGSTNQVELGKGVIESTNFPLAPTNEQRRIVSKIEELFSDLDAGEATLHKAQRLIEVYRQSVLKAAVTGELTREWRKSSKASSWEVSPLENLITINPKHPKTLDLSTEISFVPMDAVDEKLGLINPHKSRIFKDIKNGYTHFAENDVIFAKITPCMENGKSAVARNLTNRLACGSTEFFVFRCNQKKLIPDYLLLVLRQKSFRADAQHHMTGAVGQKRVPRRYLETYPINVPSLSEQKIIVDEVKRLFLSLEILKNQIIEKSKYLVHLRQSILKQAFEGKLVPQDTADEPAGELLKRISTQSSQPKATRGRKKKATA